MESYIESDEDKQKNVRVKIFKGHIGEVNSCCLSPDYQLLVTAADDSKLIIWNVIKESILCELTGHTGPVNCCSFSPDNKSIASASYDGTIRIWKTATASYIATLNGHTKSVESVCYSKDGSMLCSASWDKLLIVWESQVCLPRRIQTHLILHKLSGHDDCVKSCTFAFVGPFIGSGSWDKTVRVWKLVPTVKETGDMSKWLLRRYNKVPDSDVYVAVMRGHTGNVQAVAFSRAGLMVAASLEDCFGPSQPLSASGSWDRTVCLWNPYRAELIKKFSGHTGWVKAVNFSTNSIQLATSADDDTVRLWNVMSGECTKVYQAQTDIAQSCLFSSSGNLITSGTALYVAN